MTDSASRRLLDWNQLRTTAADGPAVLVAASFTAQPIEAHLGLGLNGRLGIVPTIQFADYNQLFQLGFDAAAKLDGIDELVVLWRIEDVFERDLMAWLEDASTEAALLDGAAALAEALRATADHAAVLVGDAPLPIGFGIDHRDPGLVHRLATLTAAVNAAFTAALDPRIDVLRVSALQAAHGSLAGFDRRSWTMYRQPYTAGFAAELGEACAAVIARRRIAPPKVVVLDCDNTLWGGVAGDVGDAGVGSLLLGDAFPGVAYRHFQVAARRLRAQGILLAVVSKNEHSTVEEAFAKLEAMALQPSDIVAERVNWEAKSANIAGIADELHLGLDSFVFVDDSSHELAEVAAQLPQVRLLQVPEDLEDLPELLADSGWFRGLQVTGDDRARTVRLQAEQDRTRAAAAMSPAEFLHSLQLRIRYGPVTADTAARTVQLINKTNQFNLTTVRRSDAELAELVADPAVVVRTIHVDDRFGDYGLVGATIVRVDGQRAEIDTLLMSCRVLGRGVETALLALLVDELAALGSRRVVGRYVATAKNGLVAELYPRHGFRPIEADPEQAAFELDLTADRTLAVPAHVAVID